MKELVILRNVLMILFNGWSFDTYRNLCSTGEFNLELLNLYDPESFPYFKQFIDSVYEDKISYQKVKYFLSRKGINAVVSKKTHFHPLYFFIVDILTHIFAKRRQVILHPNLFLYVRKAYESKVVDDLLREPFSESVKEDIQLLKKAFNSLAFYHLVLYRISYYLNPLKKELFEVVHKFVMRKMFFFVLTKMFQICEDEKSKINFANWVEDNPHKIFKYYCEELNVLPEDIFAGINILSLKDFEIGINKTTMHFIVNAYDDKKILENVGLDKEEYIAVLREVFKKEYLEVLV